MSKIGAMVGTADARGGAVEDLTGAVDRTVAEDFVLLSVGI